MVKEYIIKRNMKSKIVILLFFLYNIYLLSLSFSDTIQKRFPIEKKILNWINGERNAHGLNLLSMDQILTDVATRYSNQMLKRKRLSHIDQKGKNALQRYRAAGGTAIKIGEIIGAGDSPVKIQAEWLKSKKHRDVILNPHWRKIGIGIAPYGNNSLIIDILFSNSPINNLKITKLHNSIIVSGNFDSNLLPCIETPILIDRTSQLKPLVWQSNNTGFSFLLPKGSVSEEVAFIRIGYKDKRGRIIITNIIERLHTLEKRDTQ